MFPVNDYSEYLKHEDHLLFSDVTVKGPFSGDTWSPHFCFRVGDKIDQAVVRHLQPSSETDSCNLSIADLASITVQFFSYELLLSKAVSKRSEFPSFGKSLFFAIFAACSTKKSASTIGL